MGRIAILLVFAALAAPQSADYASCQRKFNMIRSERAGPGSRVAISARELNAYVLATVPKVAPDGVRNPHLRLGRNRAVGTALIDFAKLRRSQGQPLNWMLENLLAGERPVTVEARIVSGDGVARVDLERVQIGGLELSGDTLDWVIRHFLWEYYPDAKVGKPFELDHGMDRFEIRPETVTVVMANRPSGWRRAAPE